MMDFTETQKATQFVDAIPPEKLASKTKSTAIGVGSVLMAFVLLIWFVPPVPLWAVGVLLFFGAFSISGELVRGFCAFLPAVIRDIRAAIKGDS